MATVSHFLRTSIRRYSTHLPHDPHYRLRAYACTGYLVGAFTLPFVPPFMSTRKAKEDGSYLTRPRIEFCPSPRF